MTVRVCVTVRETTTSDAISSSSRAAEWADLVEIRADYIRDLDLQRLFAVKSCPIVFTLRSRDEGGAYEGSEEERIQTILRAHSHGADFVDIEFSSDWRRVIQTVPKGNVILSYHNFEDTPDFLKSKLDAMADTGAGILKLATRARSLADNTKIARLLRYALDRDLKVIALAMGSRGIPARILGPCWGSWLTFASLPGSKGTADGQLSADLMVQQFRIRMITSKTQIYGVLGTPLDHSLSPRIHNAVFAAQNRDAVFVPLEAASVDDFKEFCESCSVRGSSVTIPYKEEVYARCRTLSREAENVGAVNTLIIKKGGWHGENTDVEGFLRPLQKHKRSSNLRAVVLGAGGAARAVVYALRSNGASVCVVARNASKAGIIAEKFQADHVSWDERWNVSWDLLVNATPVGMYPNIHETPVPEGWRCGECVYDLVYNPAETRLLRDAAKQGCEIITGIEMFLAQAMKQQELWFGAPAPEKVMREELEQSLGKQPRPRQQ